MARSAFQVCPMSGRAGPSLAPRPNTWQELSSLRPSLHVLLPSMFTVQVEVEEVHQRVAAKSATVK